MKDHVAKTNLFWQRVGQWLQVPQAPPLLVVGGAGTDWPQLLAHTRALAVCAEKSNRPCLVCRACRQASVDHHPDIVSLLPDTNSYKVKAVRELIGQLATTSWSGRRLVIIPQAEQLLAAAANTLLKELEESHSTNRWLLTTSYRVRLLPTILSRCQTLRWTQPPASASVKPASLNELLKQMAPAGTRQAPPDELLQAAGDSLLGQIRSGQSDANTKNALLRLRDYYKIRSLNGNTKLAGDVLLASLAQFTNNLK